MPDYINPEAPSTDPVEISDDAADFIRDYFPNFDPDEAQQGWVIVLALAFRAAEINDLINMIPRSIYRNFGAKVLNYPPVGAQPAGGLIAIDVRDNAGYTIEAGFAVTIRDVDGDEHLFTLDDDAVIPALSTSVTNVSVTADEEGTSGNGITGGTVTLADTHDAIIGLTQVGSTSGGLDEEEDDVYLNRLTRRLGLVPRPVQGPDFANMVLIQFPEVYRALALDNFVPGVNEKQTIVHAATAGSFTIGFEGNTTASVNWNEPNATLQTKLEALGNIDPGDIIVTGGPLPAMVTVEFTGKLGQANRTQMTAPTNVLTGGSGSSSLVFATTQGGVAPDPAKERNITIAAVDTAGAGVSSTTKLAIAAYLDAQREWGYIVNVTDPVYTNVDVTTAFTIEPGYTGGDVEGRTETALAEYFSGATWGAPPDDPHGFTKDSTVRIYEVVTVINNVQGVKNITSLTLGVNGGAQTAADKTLNGDIPLPAPGNINALAVTA